MLYRNSRGVGLMYRARMHVKRCFVTTTQNLQKAETRLYRQRVHHVMAYRHISRRSHASIRIAFWQARNQYAKSPTQHHQQLAASWKLERCQGNHALGKQLGRQFQ